MRTRLACLLLLVFCALLVPLTSAMGTAQRDDRKKSPRQEKSAQNRKGVVDPAAPGRRQREREDATLAPRTPTTRKESAGKGTGQDANLPKTKRDVPITAEMEAEVKGFVRQHHRELVDVLERLKENVPKEYERAIRELNRQRLRLKQSEGRERHAAELQLWKAQSRVRMLGAKAQMGDDASLNDALREKLAEIYDLRTTLLRRDRERAAERLAKLEEQLRALEENREKTLEKQLLTLTKSAQKRTKPVTTGGRSGLPAAGSKATKKLSSTTSTNTID